VLLGGSDIAMRLVPVLVFLLLLALLLRVSRRNGAPLAMMVMATALCVVRREATISSDIPALLLLFVTVWSIWSGFLEDPRWLVLAAICADGAVYVRYGSLPIIFAIGLATLISFRHLLAPRARWLAVSVLIGLAGLIPFVLMSVSITGSATGMLVASAHEANRAYVGDGLVYYVTIWWWRDLGPVALAFLLLGVVAGIRGQDPRDRFFLLISGLSLLLVGLSAHGETRFAFLPLLLMIFAGARKLEVSYPSFPRWVLVAACGATWLVGAALFARTPASAAHREAADAVATVRSVERRKECRVLARNWQQLAWYTGCQTFEMDTYDHSPSPRSRSGSSRILETTHGFES
jgi:hypothetical protein